MRNKLVSVLWVESLWNDWNNIINSITNYSYILEDDLKKYNLIKQKTEVINKKEFSKAKKDYKINNWGNHLVVKNKTKIWVAQWIWLSQNLANIYMLDFDLYISNYIKKIWWKYYRYSDDILIIVKCNDKNKAKIFNNVQNEVFNYIKNIKLKIQPEKTEIFDFNWWNLINSFSYKTDKNVSSHSNPTT